MYEKMIDAKLNRKKAADVIGTSIRSKIRDSRGSKNRLAQNFTKLYPLNYHCLTIHALWRELCIDFDAMPLKELY